MTIEWKQPPTRTNRKWAPIIAQIKQRPGEWAFVGKLSVSAAYMYARRYGLQIQVVNREGGNGDIYFRTEANDAAR